ncbi:MAG: YaaR family protein [Syntrophothermus sp.]
MKIRNSTLQKDAKAVSMSGREVRAVAAKSHAPFHDALQAAQGQAAREQLDELLALLDLQAGRLKDKRDLAELYRYRDLVRRFLDIIVKEAYNVHEETGFNRRGRRKLFLLVKKVDTALEELAETVLKAQAGSLELLAKLGEIRGLLVDLYT